MNKMLTSRAITQLQMSDGPNQDLVNFNVYKFSKILVICSQDLEPKGGGGK